MIRGLAILYNRKIQCGGIIARWHVSFTNFKFSSVKASRGSFVCAYLINIMNRDNDNVVIRKDWWSWNRLAVIG